jgi:hypothetical protein
LYKRERLSSEIRPPKMHKRSNSCMEWHPQTVYMQCRKISARTNASPPCGEGVCEQVSCSPPQGRRKQKKLREWRCCFIFPQIKSSFSAYGCTTTAAIAKNASRHRLATRVHAQSSFLIENARVILQCNSLTTKIAAVQRRLTNSSTALTS